MSEKYLNTLDKQARKFEERYLTDDSLWAQEVQNLSSHLENTAELDKIDQSVRDSAQQIVNRLKTHKWELEEVDNAVVRGTAIDQFCDDVNFVLMGVADWWNSLKARSTDSAASNEGDEYVYGADSVERTRLINKKLADAIEPLRFCVKKAFEFAVNAKSVHNYDWEQVLEKISDDAVKQFGATLPLVVALDYTGDGEVYMFGYTLPPIEEGFEPDPQVEPLAQYWSQLFKPAYEELERDYADWDSRRESGEDIDITARVAERWPELHNEYIAPHKQAVVSQIEKVHNDAQEAWMQALGANKGAYGFDDADTKKAEAVINKAFDSSIEEAVTGLLDADRTRVVAEMGLRV